MNAGADVTVGAAAEAATGWVRRVAARQPAFHGAFLSGSAAWRSPDEILPMGSDVDVMVVLADDEPPPKPGKLRHDGVLLDATYLPLGQLSSADRVLGNYHLAGGLRRDTILADPYGVLRPVQREVERRFADPAWVRRRRADARARIERGLAAIDPHAGFAEQVTSWLFPTGVTTHVLLVAALRNPTIRLRYVAARETLVDYGHSDRYAELQRLLGSAELTPDGVAGHVSALARVFDLAADVGTTPFFFRSDISPEARPIAVDAGRALVAAGDHREAIFWIVATFARCLTILGADAPDLARVATPDFEAALADLGITSTADLLARAADVRAYLPELWALSEAVQAGAVSAFRGGGYDPVNGRPQGRTWRRA